MAQDGVTPAQDRAGRQDGVGRGDGAGRQDGEGLVEESLVEEVSIDGMCGVY